MHPFHASQQPARWEGQEAKGNKKGIQNLAAGPGAVMSLAGRDGIRAGGGLTAGQAAHFTVLCARLVHEGTVEAGPHG